ncbi:MULTISPECIES: DEAD/DEAH box helicase [Carnobacterium]|jgi:ATP-dependent RNA helicase CshB|uniref:DEAD-box ATP-dependent RNA helicase CshB n=3 Tax=Carnobacterium TaxID=2747 RepID=K8E4U0_CARML|nr:DEAD/DEAH box helicase [Carnobacterium maltaromaticum]AOA02326.1 DEAD/DEAH box helicase [Carnobacterium maltaromaticum]KRN60023.1 ATP-dependent RNA helicase [Carnobacterium maltaromaticum DSM 20342]KRN73491.1 ATP-dependent RNA helicase [Carnobacterium maltaromaticum]KRN85319.1 ATP-dependent RNA helicase [Carnobacterium maltaromaticum]MBC9788425.1 DEAD/DEAH box helicase [Carnobacterium maltaromaticum]
MEHTFEKFGLQPFLIDAIQEIGFTKPTEVQEKLIPEIMKSESVIGHSQTGTGKTHTFLLPLFNNIDPLKEEVQVVITTPSRELAEQIYQAALQLVKHAPNKIIVQSFVGGTDKKRQLTKLAGTQPHVVIGTPGRILDMINENALRVHTSPVLVIDEADMTLDMGFLTEVDQIASRLPNNLQMLVFSATIPTKLKPFLKKYMENPHYEHIQPKSVISPTIENWLISTKGRDRVDVVYQLLTTGTPYLAIVFANTKQKVDELADGLKSRGLKVAKIHGDIPPRERKRVMKQVQNLDYQFVVATDLAARGIDIEGVSHVINAEIPRDLDFFIHRVGRTGRNGMKGTAITLYAPSDEGLVNDIEKLGIEFVPKTIKNDEIVDTFDRNRRNHRDKTTKETLNPSMRGMVQKAKKKVKPAYKKKMSRTIKEHNEQKRRVERRSQARAIKKANKKK